MKTVLALVGRANVGKSTLFNRLTKTRDALVANFPGLTRDRNYGKATLEDREYILIDTGGLSGHSNDKDSGVEEHMASQTWIAIEEADGLLFLVDGREGLSPADQQIAKRLRRTGKPVYILVNKTDGIDAEQAATEFYPLGFDRVYTLAATQGRNVNLLMENVLDDFNVKPIDEEAQDEKDYGIKLAFIGRPNVGKSTLINRILGEQRVVAYDKPGTTRDTIFVPFERDEQKYTLIDTAGVRRRGRISETIEKFSVIKTIKAIDTASVVIMVLDAHESITDQDAHLLGLCLHAGRSLVIAVNKWDGIDLDQRDMIKKQLEVKLPFIDYADIHFISALHGTGVGHLFESVIDAYESTMIKVSTSRMTRILQGALETHQPPLRQGKRIKLRYAHQGGNNPFTVIIHGNQTEKVPMAYKKFLMNYFRQTLKLRGTQVQILFRTGTNPFENKPRVKTTRHHRHG
ncbi:MAG: ribosome biogenesis GTPase Der [Thiotrichaceae bacterium]|nr:ribosome biogenesis GTPase Der [Thiotrichaceae bacterium]